MNDLFKYYEGELGDFIAEALVTKAKLIKRVISPVSSKLVSDLQAKGILIDLSYNHTLDNNAIHHSLKRHGSVREALRGQIPITDEDLLRIPDIVDNYETLDIKQNRRNQDIIIYSRNIGQGVTYYVEEIRFGRRELAASTMYKRKKDDSPTQIDWTTQISDLSPFVQR